MHLLTAVYPDRASAAAVLKELHRESKDHDLKLFDGTVAAKSEDGKVSIHHQIDQATTGGAVGGLAAGLFLVAMFPPAALAEVVFGVAGGAAGGHFTGHKDRDAFKRTAEGIEAGKAAVVLLIDDADSNTKIRKQLRGAEHIGNVKLSKAEADRLRGSF